MHSEAVLAGIVWLRTWKCAAELKQCVRTLAPCDNYRYSQGQINVITAFMAGFVWFFMSGAGLQQPGRSEASPAARPGWCRVCAPHLARGRLRGVSALELE